MPAKDKILTLPPNARNEVERSRRIHGYQEFRSSSKPPLWIRTNAGPTIGFGHLRRSIVLGSILGDRYIPFLLCDETDRWTQAQARNRGWGLLHYGRENLWTNKPSPVALLIDTREDRGLLQLISEAHSREVPVISIHDLGLNPLPSDMVVDGSMLPVAFDFPGYDTAFYYGPSFMVLEPSFALLHRQNKRIGDQIARVCVNLGGGDSRKYFSKVLQGLRRFGRELDVTGIPGFINWGQSDLKRRDWSPLRFRWAEPDEPVERLVFIADLAITAGGLSAFEALCSGTPLAAVAFDEFQQITITTLARAGACVDLGSAASLRPTEIARALSALDSDPLARQRISRRGREIVDGRGGERVSRMIFKLIGKRSARAGGMAVL